MPKKIGRYTLGRTLGSGNFSKVRAAFVSDHPEIAYAIKIVDKEKLIKEKLEEQFKREVVVLKCLRHPNVVMMEEVMQTSQAMYLVLELVTGGELLQEIQAAGRLSEDVARKYFQQLIMGVRYCHQLGIAHRDLKPENLLLDGQGNLKISDFGLSNVQKGGMMQTLCGTPSYVAPEVLREQGYNGCIADIWSCGIILYVMLAGYLPFDDPNLNSLFNKIEQGAFEMDRCFSDPASDLIRKILQNDPLKRYTLDQIIAHPWFQVGFDPAMLINPIMPAPTEQQLANAFTPAADESDDGPTETGLGTGTGTGTGNPPPASSVGPDGFELMRWNLAGSFLPIILEKNYFPSTTFRDHRRVLLYKASQTQAAAELLAVLKDLKTNPKPHRDSPNEIKGFFNAQGGLMTYVAIVEKTVSKELSLIDIRRGRGKAEEFHSFVTQVCQRLPDGRIRSGDLEPVPY
jgi:5'-AMP-activated protein kinase catalytic alpha subunit